MNQNNKNVETLESRTLFAAGVFSTAVIADRLMVKASLLKFRADMLVTGAALTRDMAAIKADHPADDATLSPLIAQYRKDQSAMGAELAADRLTEAANALTDESVITKDLLMLQTDRKNPTALAADHTKLTADRQKLQSDLIAGLDSRIATRTSDTTQIGVDVGNIIMALSSDPNASAKLKIDAEKFASDKTIRLAAVLGDLQALVTARQQLLTDLAA